MESLITQGINKTAHKHLPAVVLSIYLATFTLYPFPIYLSMNDSALGIHTLLHVCMHRVRVSLDPMARGTRSGMRDASPLQGTHSHIALCHSKSTIYPTACFWTAAGHSGRRLGENVDTADTQSQRPSAPAM